MALHFTRKEFDDRLQRVRAAAERSGLHGMLLFAPESQFWLTGFDTFGFCFFQCLYVGVDGDLVLLTRSADLRQAQMTSIIEDVRIWTDGANANPAKDLRDILEGVGAAGKRLGVEYDTQGLTAFNGRRLEAALDDFCTLTDASTIIPAMRMVKSAAELEHVRCAARLADEAFAAGVAAIAPDASESEVLAAMQGAVFAGGGDYPANEFIVGAGENALLCRYQSGRRRIAATDQITLEWAGVWRHYHAAMMRTVCIGEASPRHVELHEAARAALKACEEALRPGAPLGDVFEAHASTLDAHGLRAHRLNACGYSLGARFSPSWMDAPMLYASNPEEAQPNMVIFIHMILMDSVEKVAMSLGHTVLVTDRGIERLSNTPLDLVVK